MSSFFSDTSGQWINTTTVAPQRFVCGYCATTVASRHGYPATGTLLGVRQQVNMGGIYICPNCSGPVIIVLGRQQVPSPPLGQPVDNVPADTNKLYEEARRCSSQGCYTAAVLLLRKLLMNIAVDHGAAPGWSFAQYITFLGDKGFVPPNGKDWIDHIRSKGNEATHEIQHMAEDDASVLMSFAEMLLRFIFDFPNRVPKKE